MANDLPIGYQTCQLLSPLTMLLDEAGKVLKVSERLQFIEGKKCIGKNIQEILQLPNATMNWKLEDLLNQPDRQILCLSINCDFAYRGQLVDGWYQGSSALILLLVPWVTWLMENSPQSINARDFPITDNQLEHLFYIRNSQLMVEDQNTLIDELEQERQKLNLLVKQETTFINHVTHELRTPLNSLSQSNELLEKSECPKQQKRLLGIISTATRSLVELVNSILDYSEINSGLASFAKNTNAKNVTENICEMLTDSAMKAGMIIELEIAEVLTTNIITEELVLKKTLLNLISNAIKHSGGDKITVRVKLNESGESDAMLVVVVADNGKGFPQSQSENLFEEFFVLDRNKIGSTGIGLAIVKKSIEQNGGNVQVWSEEGKGAEFTVSLPVNLLEKIPPDNSEGIEIENECEFEFYLQGNVLLVDDNETNCELAKILLQNLGLNVTTALSGQGAIQECKQFAFDLILMDISMPEMDGIETCRAIRSLKNYKNVPVLALTANASKIDRKRYIENSMADVLVKPLLIKEAAPTIKKYIENTQVL